MPGHLERSPLTGHSLRTYLGVVRAYLAWLERAPADGDPLNDAVAKDWAVRDYRSYLVTVAKRATATVNKQLAALQDFYVWRGLGPPQGVKRHPVPRHAPKALEPRAKLCYLRGGGVAGCPGSRAHAAAAVRRHPHRRDPRPGRCRRAAVCPQGRAAPRRQRREVPDRARTPEAARGLAALLAERPTHCGADPAALFASSRGTVMTTDAIVGAISAITGAAGLDDHVTSHVLRHTFGTELTCRGLILAGYTRRWRWSRRRRWPVPAGPRPAPGTRWRESGSRTRQCRADWPGKPPTAAGCRAGDGL
jgi:integrase